jgi:hypothetical protein
VSAREGHGQVVSQSLKAFPSEESQDNDGEVLEKRDENGFEMVSPEEGTEDSDCREEMHRKDGNCSHAGVELADD